MHSKCMSTIIPNAPDTATTGLPEASSRLSMICWTLGNFSQRKGVVKMTGWWIRNGGLPELITS